MDLMNMYGGSLYCIAAELANRSDREDVFIQDKICRKYGLSLESLSNAEAAQISYMIDEILAD